MILNYCKKKLNNLYCVYILIVCVIVIKVIRYFSVFRMFRMDFISDEIIVIGVLSSFVKLVFIFMVI